MIQDPNIIMAIDVGTSKVCTIIARREGGRRFSVLSHSVVPSQGLQKGIVTDISATQSVIRESATKAARQARATVNEAYVGVTGSHVNFENRLDKLDWAAKRGVITPADIRRVPTSVAAASAEPGRKVLHALPRNYILDGQSGIRNPLGMHTSQVKVETHVVTAAAMFIDKLNQAVRQAGVSVRELVLEPIASAEAVLTVEERESGVALVDIGGGTTDMVVYRQGTVLYNAALPIGGFQFTNDICLTYDTTYEAAEAVKLEHGRPVADFLHQRAFQVVAQLRMADEDHGQLTAALGDKLNEALERGQRLWVEVVGVVDEQRDRSLGLAKQLLQIAFAPFRLAWDRDGLLRRKIIEQRCNQQRHRYLGLFQAERARDDHTALAL